MQWHYRNTLLVSCTFAFFVTFFARVAISPVIPFITSDLSITNTHVGIALSGMWIAYGLSQYPSGKLAERFGEKRVILLSVGATSVLSVITALASGFGMFVFGVVGIGAVAGLHYTAASTLLSRTYENIGTALGFHSLGAPAAGLVAPAGAAWVGTHHGWRPAIALVTIIAIPVLALIFWMVEPTEPSRPNDRATDQEPIDSFVSFLFRPTIAFSAVVAIIGISIVNGLVSFLPTFLVDYHGYSPTLAGAVFSVFFVCRGAAQIGVGAISDRRNRDAVIASCFFVGAIGLVLFIVDPGFVPVLTAVLMTGIGVSFLVALEPKVLDSMSETDRSAGFGVFRTVFEVGASVGPIAVGASADVLGWRYTFTILAMLFGFSFLLVLMNELL